VEELDEYLTLIKPFFSSIEGKTILEYACFAGDWWKMFALHSPKKVIAFDKLGYKLEDHMNISCKARPSKERVAMMRFIKK
jgi:hypothetical protein